MTKPKIDLTTMTDAERLDLLDRVWESFCAAPETLPLTDAQRDELDRRLTALDRGEMTVRPWHGVREEIRRELKNRP